MVVRRRVAFIGAVIVVLNLLVFRRLLSSPLSSASVPVILDSSTSTYSYSFVSPSRPPSSASEVTPPTPRPPTPPPSPRPTRPPSAPTPLVIPTIPDPDAEPAIWWGRDRPFNHSLWNTFPRPRLVNFPADGKFLREGLERRKKGELGKTFIIASSGYDPGAFRLPATCPFKCQLGGGNADAAMVAHPGGGGAPLTFTFGLESSANSWWGHAGSFSSFSFSMRSDLDATVPMLGQLKSFLPIDPKTGMLLHERLPLVPFAVKKKRAKIMSMMSNCESNRLTILDKLNDMGITKAQYGGCGRNAEFNMPWDDLDPLQEGILRQFIGKGKWLEKEALAATHLFHFAAENSICDFYHTEKLFGALKAGTVPVYMGARTIYPYLPEKSVLFVYDYPNVYKLAEHLHELESNETKYNEYLAWRTKPLAEPLLDLWTVAQAERSPDWQCEICSLVATTPPGHYESHDPTDCEGFPMDVFLSQDGDLPSHVKANMLRDKPFGRRW